MTLKIIGAGWGRTGTKSLKLSLEHLGLGPCHHMSSISEDPKLLTPWADAAAGKTQDWEAVFDGYQAQLDWPGTRYWRELAVAFPKAQIILTLRDPDDWYASMERTIIQSFRTRHDLQDANRKALLDMAAELVGNQIFDNKLEDRASAIRKFNQHIADVQKEISPERLLVLNVSDGWSPLCRFLDLPIPDIKFPMVNSTTQYQQVNRTPE